MDKQLGFRRFRDNLSLLKDFLVAVAADVVVAVVAFAVGADVAAFSVVVAAVINLVSINIDRSLKMSFFPFKRKRPE